MKPTRVFAFGLALALSLFTLSGCGGQSASNSTATSAASQSGTPSDAPYHLRVNYSSSLCLAPMHVAQELGFFEAEGLDVEFVRVEAAAVPEAIGAGKIDAGLGLIGKFLQQVENGLPIKFTAGVHTGCIQILVPKDSGIDSPADLRGKKIGVSGLAGAETVISKRVLANEGISFDEKNPEVEFVVYSQADLGQALENGSIDVIATIEPAASQFVQQYDLNVLIDTATSDEFKNEYCCDTFVTEKLASEHPDVAAAYTRAILKASVYVQRYPEETAQLQVDKKYVTGDAAFNAEILKRFNYNPSVQGGYDAVKESTQQLSEIGVMRAGIDAKAFTDDLFLFYDDVPETYTWEDIAPQVEAYTDQTTKSTGSAAAANTDTTAGGDCCSTPIPVSAT